MQAADPAAEHRPHEHGGGHAPHSAARRSRWHVPRLCPECPQKSSEQRCWLFSWYLIQTLLSVPSMCCKPFRQLSHSCGHQGGCKQSILLRSCPSACTVIERLSIPGFLQTLFDLARASLVSTDQISAKLSGAKTPKQNMRSWMHETLARFPGSN